MTATAKLPRAKQLSPVQIAKARRAYLLAFLTIPQCQVSDALDVSGATLGQLETWRETDPEFAALEKQVSTQKADDNLRKQIEIWVAAGDRDMLKAAMKRLPEYNPARKTEVAVSGEVTHKHLATKTEEELDEIIRAGNALVIEPDFEVVKNDPKQIAQK